MLEQPTHTNEGKKRNKTINNTDSDKIVITKDKLYRKLHEYKGAIEQRNLVFTFLSLFVALIIPYVTCDFKDRLGLTADMWKGITLLLCIAMGILTLVFGTKAIIYRKVNIKSLIERICEKDDLD